MPETVSQGASPGVQLTALCAQGSTEVILCAPFIKVGALERVLGSVPAGVTLKCVTRWRPDEIAWGVSDLEVWPLLRERGESSLWLCSSLHAKYYRVDTSCLIGSANITATALGWAVQSNLELLASMPLDHPSVAGFESRLFASSTEVDNSIYDQMCGVVEIISAQFQQSYCQFETMEQTVASEHPDIASYRDPCWLPTLRNPEELFLAYSGHIARLSSASQEAACSDLATLAVPSGLPKEAFEAYVAALLLQQPVIRVVDALAAAPQRFGAVRDAIAAAMPKDRVGFDADRAWQTLMRWLRHFLPNRYGLSVPNHSEVFYRTAPDGGDQTRLQNGS